jgi:hypothetical protein
MMSDVETIVITSEDLEKVEVEAPAEEEQKPSKPKMPTWRRLLTSLLIFFPPVLFVVCIVDLVRTLRKETALRHAYAMHYWALLLVSCVLWSVVTVGLSMWMPTRPLPSLIDNSAITVASLPTQLPERALTGRDIAQQFSPLVVAVFHPGLPHFSIDEGMMTGAIGAGAIAYADRHGFLVLTSWHVVEDLSHEPGVGQEVGVFVQENQKALATVVGVHHELDLALLWVGRDNGETTYLQPLRPFVSVEVGEQVFAIGHPQGLAFSISSGLVAQKRGDDHVQISAPVSPGNSGGPVFDRHGHLLGIVEFVIDKEINPNAENLNFAVRVDDLFVADAWTLDDTGRSAMDSIAAWEEEPVLAEEDTEQHLDSDPEA